MTEQDFAAAFDYLHFLQESYEMPSLEDMHMDGPDAALELELIMHMHMVAHLNLIAADEDPQVAPPLIQLTASDADPCSGVC
jgi:hypothetical protein